VAKLPVPQVVLLGVQMMQGTLLVPSPVIVVAFREKDRRVVGPLIQGQKKSNRKWIGSSQRTF
jgi:hypothetical protein